MPIECNLCGMMFRENGLLEIQKRAHERWHSMCKMEGRNTTEGQVEWMEVK